MGALHKRSSAFAPHLPGSVDSRATNAATALEASVKLTLLLSPATCWKPLQDSPGFWGRGASFRATGNTSQ